MAYQYALNNCWREKKFQRESHLQMKIRNNTKTKETKQLSFIKLSSFARHHAKCLNFFTISLILKTIL